MTDDLYNIDDLFREGLEGHEEEVPRSVWQGVSNDLDKKQASFYKNKYNRLKRVAWSLVMLCMLVGGYFIVHVSNDKQRPAREGKSRTTIQSPASENENQQTSIERKAIQKNTQQNTGGDSLAHAATSSVGIAINTKTEKLSATLSATRSNAALTDLPLIDKEVKAQKATKSKAELKNESLTIVANESFIKKQSTKNIPMKENMMRKKNLEGNRISLNQTTSVSTSLPAIIDFPLLERSFRWPEFKLQVSPPYSLSEGMNTANSPATKMKRTHNFLLSAFVAPNFSFDRLEDDDHLSAPGRDRREARRDEKDNVSFSAGLLFNYKLSKNWGLESGITVTSSSTSIAPKTVYAKADYNGHTRYELHCSSGYVYLSPKGGVQPIAGDSAQTLGTTSKLTYVTIPASVTYRIDFGRLRLLPAIGAGLNILTNSKTKTLFAATSESATTSISGLKSNYAEGRFGIGVEYGLGKGLSLSLRPNARIALTPINEETPVKSYQNFLSVETGVRVRF